MCDEQVQTHVISSIVHIAHQYDNDEEPWPIEIEDHDGNLHAVNLEPGQVFIFGVYSGFPLSLFRVAFWEFILGLLGSLFGVSSGIR